LKILFLTPRLPFPPNRGDRLRYFNFAKVLSRKHSLSLISFIQSEKELSAIGGCEGIFDRVETVLLKPWRSYVNMALCFLSGSPLQVAYFHSRKMRKKIEETMKKEKYDAVYTFHLRMAPYSRGIKNAYKILDLTDAVSLFLRRMISHRHPLLRPIFHREAVSTNKYESEIVDDFDESWLISDLDRRAIECRTKDDLIVVPNGIDTDHFVPDPSFKREENSILFVGYMGVESVVTVKYFLKEIFPKVLAKIPSAKFYIVGADPPPEIKKLSKDKNIIVTGYIEDLRQYYGKASVLIAPMRFVAGVQNKILEAMAMEVPVVTSSLGNEGIDAAHGENIFVEDDPDMFALRVVDLLKDKALRESVGSNARKYVKGRFAWDSVAERMDRVAEIIAKNNTLDKSVS